MIGVKFQPVKNLWWINVRNNAASGKIIIDNCRIDKTFRNNSGFLDRLYNEIKDPLRNGVALPLGVQLLIAGAPGLQLIAVDVALAEKISKYIKCYN